MATPTVDVRYTIDDFSPAVTLCNDLQNEMQVSELVPEVPRL